MHGRARLILLTAAVALAVVGCTAASAGGRGLPTPRPEAVRASGTISVFPVPGTPAASPSTTISFRGVAPNRIGPINVFGARTGEHKGHLVAHSDGRGASFVPDDPFDAGEIVTVHTDLSIRGAQHGTFTYTISRPADRAPTNVTPPSETSAEEPQHFVTRPDLQPPAIQVKTSQPGVAAGDVFLTPNPTLGLATRAQSGPMIVDNRGNVVWFSPHKPASTLDFSMQQYDGRPVLSWFEGQIRSAGYGDGDFVLADDTYREIARIRAANGYLADIHDFLITPQNTALLIAYNPVVATARSIGRVYDRVVDDAVIQEIDIPTGAVLFEWHSLGTIDLNDSYLQQPAKTSDPYDYMHPNSIALDADGNIWLSARHTWTVYKIDRVTGAVYWRLGGKRSNFKMGDGTQFAWQHDARPRGGDRVSIFDNEASAPGVASSDRSRGLVLAVDESRMTVSLVRADDNPQHALALSQGDFQQLPNRDFLAGWGSVPEYTEFGPKGAVLLDANIIGGSASYRAFRFAWHGHPSAPPDAVARTDASGLTVFASWNGATDVVRWRVSAGADRSALQPAGSFATTGFETKMTMPAPSGAHVVRIEAMSDDGRVLGTSRAITVH